MKSKQWKKFFTVLLAIAIVFTSMPLSGHLGFIDTADAKATVDFEGKLDAVTLLNYKWPGTKWLQIWLPDFSKKQLRIQSTIEADNLSAYHVDGFRAFCVEHGVHHETTNPTFKGRKLRGSAFENLYEARGRKHCVENIIKVLFYAPTEGSGLSELISDLGFKESRFYKGGYSMADWIAASQALIWECQQDMRDKDFNRHANGLYYVHGFVQNSPGVSTGKAIEKDHYTRLLSGKPAMDIYNFMAASIKNLDKNIDKKLAATSESKPKVHEIPEDATFPYTFTVKAGSNGAGEYQTYTGKNYTIESTVVNIKYDKTAKEYTITLKSKAALDKTYQAARADSAGGRARKYLKKGDKYQPMVWTFTWASGHSQSFVSGLQDPMPGYFKFVKGEEKEETPPGTCEPPDVEVFPSVRMPIEKIDANAGFDGDTHTPMGDAGLDATYTLERNIDGKGWETIDSYTLDDFGSQYTFEDQPFADGEALKEYLTESGSLTACDHPITDADGNIIGYEHTGSKEPTRKVWEVTVEYRITETRPDGRYIDPDQYGGKREYQFTYHAESEDTCQFWCHGDPWTDVEYTFGYGATVGDGTMHAEGPATKDAVKDELDCDLETFVNDEFRGEIQIIKSNEKENPFKDSAMGGADMNISHNSCWTIKLISGGFEGRDYLHLLSTTPQTLPGGTLVYTASRAPGVANNTLNGGSGMKTGNNGTLIIKDVPYGTYLVEERKADDPMYVLEKFTVVVAEHNGTNVTDHALGMKDQGSVPLTGSWADYGIAGTNPIGSVSAGTGDYYNNRYDANLRDKIKTNVIQLQKVDSETGKLIPLKGTKVYLRYKGNPDYTDEENQKRYGENGTEIKNIYNRFLPNAESITSASTNYTFELDKNGKFTVAYELPYGKYEICEWLLPDGYYVGWYDEDGNGHNHDFGMIEEGEFKLSDISGNHSFEDTVAIYDKNGNRVKYKEKEEYSFESLEKMVTNRYTFKVEKQADHEDGNFTQLVPWDGSDPMDADPTYDSGEHPYTKYYKVAAVINNAVKGKITVEKLGEELTGFQKVVKDGYEVLQPVFEKVTKLKDAVFGIFAAKDELLNDGSEGPAIYDAETDELITIAKTKSTNTSNVLDTIKAFVGKLLHPKEYTAEDYETGEYSHASGAELWTMSERAASEGNVKRTLYVTPEQKDTVYKYTYQMTDGKLNYRWDVEVRMSNKAGGQSVTDVNITKTTSSVSGCVDDITLTHVTGSVGDHVLDPIENFRFTEEGSLVFDTPSLLTAGEQTYAFEADGETITYKDGTENEDGIFNWADGTLVDLSSPCPDRYMVKDYAYYKLRAADLTEETRTIDIETEVPGVDLNGDGDYDDPGETPPTTTTTPTPVTKKAIEWREDPEGKAELISTPVKGEKTVLRFTDDDGTESYKIAVEGYYTGGEYTNLCEGLGAGGSDADYVLTESRDDGTIEAPYTIPEGWNIVPFTGDPKTDPQYVIIAKTDTEKGETQYRVLLDDLVNWQTCKINGNFTKAVVQSYQVRYVQEKNDPNGFTLQFDDFALAGNVDQKTGAATTNITRQNGGAVAQTIDCGLGYTYEDLGDIITFTTIPMKAPIYFMTESGIRTEIYYKGGVALTTITLPQSAIDYLYKDIVPTLTFNSVVSVDSDEPAEKVKMNLDWYSQLTPENPEITFDNHDGLPEKVRATAKRHEAVTAGEEAWYTIEIVTDQTEEHPLQLTFADGYKMDIYTAQAASGNGVGVLDLYNVYKTNRYTQADLVETITTNEDGLAESKLLPLGEYIVRELSSDDNYVNEGRDKLVSLKYKDQFTPLIWGDTKFDNKYMTVQLDLSKVFETAYQSGEYQPPKEGQQVLFGLYAAEDITATKTGILTGLKKTIKKDSLIDVITIDHTNQGIVTVDEKLPEGAYYLKEIEAPADYIMSDIKYHFAVREDDGEYSENTTFDYTEGDGVFGKFVLEEKGHVKVQIAVEARYPMPTIKMNGIEYALTEDLEVKDTNGNPYLQIDADKDYTEIFVDTYKGSITEITLPNGKEIKVEPEENTFTYTVDGQTHTFFPTVTYTGYHGKYEELWPAVKGEDLNTHQVECTLTGAGSDQKGVIVKAAITHTPSVTVTTEEVLIDPDQPELGYETKDITKGNLTPEGDQIFMHQAVVTVKNSEDINEIAGTYTRTSGKETVTETIPDNGEILLNPNDTLTLRAASGAVVTVFMDTYGNVKVSVENTL